MFKTIILVALGLVICHADDTVTCGLVPNSIFSCLGHPRVIDIAAAKKCSSLKHECEGLTCMYRESGWLDGNNVNKQKVKEYFDKYASEHPEWSPAVQHLKTACLGEPLQAQGAYLNCPAYDITHCALTSFIKKATASQWPKGSQCDYSRRFVAACPVCPEDCFAYAIPIGSCNACKATNAP